MRNACVALTVAAVLLSGAAVAAEHPTDPQFQQAVHLLRTNGDPVAASVLFEKLSRSPDRELAAWALLYLGECRERIGAQTARETYQRILREFGNQPTLTAEARQRLAAGNQGGSPPAGLSMRQVWVHAPDNPGNPSADGRLLTFVDWETGNVAVRDLWTGQDRRLTQKGSGVESPEYAEWPKITPDGKRVVYAWATSNYGREMRVVDVEAGPKKAPQVVLQIPDIHYIIPWAWSPDGKSVLTLLSRGDDTNQLAWVSVGNGAIRALKSLEWRWPIHVSLSPDGRFLAYDVNVSEEEPERDIFIMTADGSRELPLIRHPADDYAPLWSPDGEAVLFTSTRNGAAGIWSVPVASGQATGVAELLKGDLGQIMPLGLTRDGVLFYVEHRGMDDVYSAELDRATGKVRGDPLRLVDNFVGRNSSSVWSPDGQLLAYFSNRSSARAYGVGTRDVVIRSVETGRERVFSGAKLDLTQGVRWMPDSQSILMAVRGLDTRRRVAFSTLNVVTGEMRTITRSNVTLPFLAVPPDGRSFVVAGGDQTTNVGSITRYDVATGEGRELYRAPADFVLRNLAISHDGRLLAMSVAHPALRRHVIYTLPLTGGEPQEVVRLTEGIGREGLAWTPDGRYLLFVKATGLNRAELFRVPASGGIPESTGISARGLSFLNVHPDGTRITYTVGQYFQTDIWALENFLPGPRTSQ